MLDLLILKRIYFKKDQRVILCAKILKSKHRYQKVAGSEVTFMHKASIFLALSHYQAEQIKKGVICPQIVLEIHQTEHRSVISSVYQLNLTLVLVVVFQFS